MKEINLTKNKVSLVDDEDFEKLNQYKWFAKVDGNTFYACKQSSRKINNGKQILIKMHNYLMNPCLNFVVDHIDGNGLNNQKSNLRICTHSQNLMNQGKKSNNTSGYKGVTWNKIANKWQTQISINNKTKHLGLFAIKEDAYNAYCEACKKYHGEFAHL